MNKIERKEIAKIFNLDVLSFIGAGVACYAFSLVDEIGLLEALYRENQLEEKKIFFFPNPLVLQRAFQVLESYGIVSVEANILSITPLGKALYQHKSSINWIYSGYRNVLASQLEIALDEPGSHIEKIDFLSVAKASQSYDELHIKEYILDELKSIGSIDLICDLGCGTGALLRSLCIENNCRGIGFDVSKSVVNGASKLCSADSFLKITLQDITKISKKYTDVDVLTQVFVMHDIPDDKLVCVLRKYMNIFPKVKKFIYIDAVAPAKSSDQMLPGFDYVHSLLNVRTRTKKETSELIKKSGWNILDVKEISGLVNCYFWILGKNNE